mgnify:CR=1 FL=1
MTDQELIQVLRESAFDIRIEYADHWTEKTLTEAADRLTAVLGELERVTRERDAAVECIQFIATYMELDSMKDIRKMIETWKADGRRRKREKDTHM